MNAKRNFHDEPSVNPEYGDHAAKDGGASPKLLEQLNSQKIVNISEKVSLILEVVSDKANNNQEARPSSQNAQGGFMLQSFQSFIKWVGLSLPIIAAVIGATVWINTTIDNKARENRLDMKTELDAAKTEIKAEIIRTQDTVNRLDDKIDRKMDRLSEQLTTIQQEIREPKKQ